MVMGEFVQETDLLVIGSGPGGYAAAFRAADLGLEVTIVDTAERPGGACLFRGCIPSKTLLYLTELMHDARRAAPMGIAFAEPTIDLAAVRSWKSQVIDRLAGGLVSLSRERGVQLIRGRAEFASSTQVRLHDAEVSGIKFRHCILATGSRPILLPEASAAKGGRVMTSTGALALADVPASLLVVGGGYVGLELGSVYASLGSRVELVELGDRLLPGTDPDLVEPLQRRLERLFAALHFNTRVSELSEAETGVSVTLESAGEKRRERFERVLVAIGRQPNSRKLGLENTKIRLDAHAYVVVDAQQRTDDKRIFAVGDVVGGAMLAHKAIHEGKTAAEVIAGRPAAFDVRAIPAVPAKRTDPGGRHGRPQRRGPDRRRGPGGRNGGPGPGPGAHHPRAPDPLRKRRVSLRDFPLQRLPLSAPQADSVTPCCLGPPPASPATCEIGLAAHSGFYRD